MKREEAAYIAGIIDGEGSIYLERFKAARSRTRRRRNRTPWQYRISAIVTMCDMRTVRFIAKTTGRSIMVRKLPAKYSELGFRRRLVAYTIVWRNGFAERFLREILPYLRGKKRKAVLAIQFQERYSPGRGRPFQKHLVPKYEALRKKISAA